MSLKRLTVDAAIDEIRHALEDMGDADCVADMLRIVKGCKVRIVHPDEEDADEGQTEVLLEADGL